jgi:hypothetical protein
MVVLVAQANQTFVKLFSDLFVQVCILPYLAATITCFLAADLPVNPELVAADITYKDTHIVTMPRYLTCNLDIDALKMGSVNMLVA